jgi:hypothetical protein
VRRGVQLAHVHQHAVSKGEVSQRSQQHCRAPPVGNVPHARARESRDVVAHSVNRVGRRKNHAGAGKGGGGVHRAAPVHARHHLRGAGGGGAHAAAIACQNQVPPAAAALEIKKRERPRRYRPRARPVPRPGNVRRPRQGHPGGDCSEKAQASSVVGPHGDAD